MGGLAKAAKALVKQIADFFGLGSFAEKDCGFFRILDDFGLFLW